MRLQYLCMMACGVAEAAQLQLRVEVRSMVEIPLFPLREFLSRRMVIYTDAIFFFSSTHGANLSP